MNASTLQALAMPEPLAAPMPGAGQLEGHPHGRAYDLARRGAIARHLEVARSRIEEVIGSCVRRESQGDLVETDNCWQLVPHHLTGIDSLRRLRRHLDRLAARFRATLPHGEVQGAADPLHKLDLALADCAGAMVRRFEVPDVRHDLQADLESDLCKFERLLDERALLYSGNGRQQRRDGPDLVGGVPAVKRPEGVPVDGARPGRGEDPLRTSGEYRDVLRRVDRHIAEAEGDPPLQAFRRGVKSKYREELERRSPPIGEATIPILIEPSPPQAVYWIDD